MRHHPSLHWNCLVSGCDGYIKAQELCTNHQPRWYEAKAAGTDRLEFLRTAPLVPANRRLNPPTNCRVPRCGRPAERNMLVELCTFHRGRWAELTGSIRTPDNND